MYLTEYEEGVYQWLESIGIKEKFPYIENGVEGEVSTMEEIYYRAVLSYQTFSLIDRGRAYSPNDFKNIELIKDYQRKIGAYYAPFWSKRNLTEQEMSDFSHEKLKGIFTKAHRVNRGIYYLSSLRGYTSTTLFLNPSYKCLKGSNRKSKIRVYGRIQKVLPETLRLYDGTTAIFDFPFAINGLECSTDSIYRVYKLAFENAGHFELLANRGIYSGQQKRIIKQLIELGGKVNGKSR